MQGLGVTINTEFTRSPHAKALLNKCNRTMGMIKRAASLNVPVNITTSLHRTLVYCSSLWSPIVLCQIKAIDHESIQRVANRYILNYPEINNEQRYTILHLHPLSY